MIDLDGTPVRAMRDISTARLAEIEPVEEDLARRGFRAAELDLRYKDQVIARLP
jgi:cell division protein FtsQ